MPLGYCTECKALKPIRPVALKLGSRECEWRPDTHSKLVHARCGVLVVLGTFTCSLCGDVKAGHECERVRKGLETVTRDDNAYRCERCGPVDAEEVETERCYGDQKDIR